PVQSRTHVVVIATDEVKSSYLLASVPLPFGLVGECGEVVGMSAPGSFRVTALLQLFERELANRFMQQVPRAAVVSLTKLDEAVIDELLKRGGRVVHRRSGYLFDGFQHPPAPENAQILQENLFGWLEQLVAPADRIPERSLPGG